MDDKEIVLDVQDLQTHFRTKFGTVKAVDGVTFSLKRGETMGIVGESGSGKSVTVLSLMRLVPIPPGEIVGGKIFLDGEDILELSELEMVKVRGSKIAMILQDPMTSLNPVFQVGSQVGEAIHIHQKLQGNTLLDRVIHVLRQVKIPAAESRIRTTPTSSAVECARGWSAPSASPASQRCSSPTSPRLRSTPQFRPST